MESWTERSRRQWSESVATAVTKSLNSALSAIGAALLYKRIPRSQSTNYSE